MKKMGKKESMGNILQQYLAADVSYLR